ncbi:MAG: restriction endonuclease [Candidatus Dormibacteria bacterium]
MEEALARAAALRREVQSALELKAIAALPPGQRPTTWAGPSAAALFDMTTGWDRMYPMTWWQFEGLVAETFRRLGFEDVEVVAAGRDGDGGVDIRMRHKGSPCILQVKHFAADAYVKIDMLRALSDRANREKATAYLVTSGQVGQTARRDMAKADPQVFVVDGELLWKWMRKARGEQSDVVVLVPGQKLIQATSDPEGEATPIVSASAKSGCLSVLVIAAALLGACLAAGTGQVTL